MHEKIIRFIDLFGGIGGFRLGLEKANKSGEYLSEWTRSRNNILTEGNITDTKTDGAKGQLQDSSTKNFTCIWYCDIDKYAVQTYNKNFKEQYEPTDIRTIKAEDIPDFDMFCGGFPCQSFSIAGKRKGFQDIRGTLFFEIYRIAKAKKPRLLFLENVKGLLSADDGRCFGTIISSLDELGYDVEWQVLNSKNFGVPQNRERVFIIGHLRGAGGQAVFPLEKDTGTYFESGEQKMKVKSSARSFGCSGSLVPLDGVTDTLTQSMGTGGNNVPMINLHQWRTGEYGTGIKENESFTLDQGSGRDYVVVHSTQPRSPDRPSLKYSQGGSGHLSRKDGYSYCLDSRNCIAIEKENLIRRLTPVECERLQGFPDNWTSGISDTQRYKQLGNAVTVNVIQAIGEKLSCYFHGGLNK